MDPRWRRAGVATLRLGRVLAGPVLITASVLGVLWDFAFRGLLSAQHPDLIQAWLPYHCFLGKSLAAGHIPAWNPYAAAGAPFAADPQSGWMYLPAMALYSAAPCYTALGLFLVLQPVLGGLGVYWFLRAEGRSRPAATAGGLVLALMISGSTLVLQLPFSGTMAWTALLLGAAARCLRASTWAKRLLWAALCAACWGQVAAAHLSHGLVLGTSALLAYLAARLITDLRARRRRARQAFGILAVLALALPVLNLAVLLPRLAYLPRTSFALGYNGLAARAANLAGHAGSASTLPAAGNLDAAWPLLLMTSGGTYLGVLASVLSLSAFWDRRLRAVAAGFLLYGAAGYALSLRVVESKLAGPLASLPFVDFYEHAPMRMAHATRFSLAILAGLGVEAWIRARGPVRRGLMLASGLAVWWVGAALAGDLQPGPSLLAIGLAGGAAALALSAWRPRFALFLPVVLALELTLNGVWSEAAGRSPPGQTDLGPLRKPTVAGAAYLEPQPIERFLRDRQGARYVTLATGGLEVKVRGGLARAPEGWNAAADQRSMLFGLEDADVYNPAQSLRYWSLVRAASRGRRRPKYNAGYFTEVSPLAFDLLDVGWVVAPAGRRLPPGARPVMTASGWTLFRLSPPPRASVFTSWARAPTADGALAAVSAPGFRTATRLVVEGWPAQPTGGTGETRAVYRSTGPQSARIDVTTDAPSVVLVRNSYDPNWRATVDGRPAPVLAADYVAQGVPVPAGTHVVELRYEDRTIGLGLLLSGVSLAALLGLALAAHLWPRKRRRSSGDAAERPGAAQGLAGGSGSRDPAEPGNANRAEGKQKWVRKFPTERGRIDPPRAVSRPGSAGSTTPSPRMETPVGRREERHASGWSSSR